MKEGSEGDQCACVLVFSSLHLRQGKGRGGIENRLVPTDSEKVERRKSEGK